MNLKEIKSLWYKLVKSGVGAVFNIKLDLGEVILGLPPLAVQQKVNTAKHYLKICIKVSPDWICAVTSRFTKLFYCERPNIAHI